MRKRKVGSVGKIGGGLGLFFSLMSHTLAAGFALTEQSASGLGNAYAGAAASAQDISTIFFNPAGLTQFSGTQVTVGGSIIKLGDRFSNNGSHTAFGEPLTGGDGGQGGGINYVPNLYLAKQLKQNVWVGLGVNAPFGLSTSYDTTWKGRYHATASDLKTVNINPTLTVRMSDKVSLGGGINFQYMKAKLSNAIDFGALCYGAENDAILVPGTCNAYGLTPQSSDGSIKVEGHDWNTGYNMGVMFEFSPDSRMGVAYRSSVKHRLRGSADFTVPYNATLLTNQGALFKDTGVTAEVTLPESLSISAYHKIHPQWALMGDVTWTNWSRFKELVIQFDNPQQNPAVQPEDWSDSYRVSLGANYFLNTQWTFRGGVAYDQTPIPSAERRTPRLPGDNRSWMALGFSYHLSKQLWVDVGYAHLFIDKARIDNVDENTQARLVGAFDFTVDILGAQVNWSIE